MDERYIRHLDAEALRLSNCGRGGSRTRSWPPRPMSGWVLLQEASRIFIAAPAAATVGTEAQVRPVLPEQRPRAKLEFDYALGASLCRI